MPDDTHIQFPSDPQNRVPAPLRARRCTTCGTRFSNDARFCPFDGEPLEETDGSPPPPDPLIGTTIDDRYEVIGTLGEGGMGTVYHVRHRLLGKQLALKALRADLARDGDLGQRFIREARAAASVAHPNVVQITDFGNLPSGQPYFVMELLVGESLSTLLRKGGPLPAARATRLLTQIVDALSAAHVAGVVHRDLKPDNILICPGPSGDIVKVLDFGLAKVAGQSRLTKAGVVFGTPYYMSPEQASGDPVDERADVYALGVVMYEMFTGRVPFEADTFMGVLTKHIYVEPTPPSVLLGGLAALGALEQITLRCLEKKPDRRFPSMRALGEELSRVASFGEDGSFSVSPLELRITPGKRSSPRLADELELPSVVEMRAVRRGRKAGRAAPWMLAIGVLAVISALVAILLSRARTRSSSRQTAASASAAPAGQPNEIAAAATPSAALPGLQTSVAPSLAPSPSSSPPKAPLRAPDSRGLPQSAKSESPSSETARAAAPATQPKSSTKKEKMLGSELVDPWSR